MFVTDPARFSTLVLTSLMVIGLVFFIRASTKDRIEVAQFSSSQPADALQKAVMKYFYTRAYRPADASSTELSSAASEAIAPVDDKKAAKKAGPTILNGTTLVGMVSPSIFMAVFLSGLAAVGFVCLGLIVATLFPSWGSFLLGLVLLSPLAGVFYWKKSSRPEKIVLRVDSQADKAATSETILSKLVIKGHRDELAELQTAFSQPELKEWANLQVWDTAD